MIFFSVHCRFLIVLIICCGFVIQGEKCFAQVSSGPGGAQQNLQRWIEQDLFFFKDRGGQARLFLRREPVRVALSLGSTPIKDDLRYLISKLSKAAGVSYEFAASEVNLAIIVDSPINSGDKPNPALWRRIGLSDEMYTIVSETGNWSSGCGIYSFGNAETGQVGLMERFVLLACGQIAKQY